MRRPARVTGYAFEAVMSLFLVEYRGDDAGISLLEDTVGNPRTEFPRSKLLHFLQDAQDFAPVRGRFPGVGRVVGTPRPRAFGGGGSHGNDPDEFPVELCRITLGRGTSQR